MTRMLIRSRRNPSFMKLLFNDFTKKLLIPPKFVRLHPGTLPRKCTLKPTGTQSSWPVRTKLIDNHLYFKKGWKAFAKHHSLQYGDMLIFRYAQDSEFCVDMFDKTCCLREPVTTSTALILPGQEKKDDPDKTCCLREPVTTSTALILPGQETEDDPETAADELILTSKFPSFKRTMKISYVRSHGYLQIPPEFARTYVKEITNYTSKLVFLDKVWIVKLSRAGVFNKGWSNFAKEKSLEPGDVCVFQLINANDNTFEVTIFRKPRNEQGGTLVSLL